MKSKTISFIYLLISLAVCILLFTFFDYLAHGLTARWKVPDYYFKNKIIYGFLWGIVLFFVVRKMQNIWLKSAVFSGIIRLLLQLRYYIEGYDLSFVVIFLFIHFIILYFLSAIMFFIIRKFKIIS